MSGRESGSMLKGLPALTRWSSKVAGVLFMDPELINPPAINKLLVIADPAN